MIPLRRIVCFVLGHRLSLYDTERYGPVLVCNRCLDEFFKEDAP